MIYKAKFTATARRDLNQTIAWYEDIRAQLARQFEIKVSECVARLCNNPHLYAVRSGNVRSIKVGRFPYDLFYEIVGQQIVVLAVLHQSRYPRFGHH